MRSLLWVLAVGLAIFAAAAALMRSGLGLDVYAVDEEITAAPSDCDGGMRFAVIGDFGDAGQAEADVAALVASWQVEFVVTVGDNNYPDGESATIDGNIGQYYSSYIHPYRGRHGPGAAENRFWPALGNHDWRTGSIQAYIDYFSLPGNERYYDLVRNDVHLFILDSDPHEPDGRTLGSRQARWLAQQMKGSDASWQLVFLHHPPYASSITRGDDEDLQWPFASWGADAVIGGHHHFYERLEVGGIPFIINGLGGRSNSYNPIYRFLNVAASEHSLVRYNMDHGALQVNVNESCLNLSFFNRQNELIDSVTLVKPGE